MNKYKMPVTLNFRPGETALYIFLITLAIFILGVQIGIKHGRELQLEDIYYQSIQGVEYGNNFSN